MLKKNSLTFVEVILGAFILALAIAVVLSMISSGTMALARADDNFVALKDASRVLERIKLTSRGTIVANKDNCDYWGALIDESLVDEQICIENVNSSDTSWTDDPLGVRVRVDWKMRGYSQSLTVVSYITD